MDEKYMVDDILNEQYCEYLKDIFSLPKKRDVYKQRNNLYQEDNNFYLSESDFYPSADNRVLKSFVEDINGGDNFADYCEEFFEMLEEEGYYD